MKKLIPFLLLLIAIISSCKKDDNNNTPYTGYSYAPSNVGHEVIYDVDSIIKSDFSGVTDTFHFQIREVVESIFTDNQGRPTMRLERYKRLTPSDPWIIYKVWTANLTSTHYEKKEDNITYVKLIFPPALNSTWNGNSLNTEEELDYKYTSVNEPGSYNGISFDSTLTVLQNEYDDGVLDKVLYQEQYATGVGMYYKIQDSIHYDYVTDSVQFRRLYTEKIVSYSN